MAKIHEALTTGLPGLDDVLKGLLPGDNVVWRMEDIEDYLAFVRPFCEAAREDLKKLVYFRFAGHEPLLPPDLGAEVHELHPERGFEAFIADVHRVIENAGRGAYYLFDCLSDLIVDWYSDQMLGNFFMLTCPYLYDLETVTYFGLLRNHHSSHATLPIQQTTQLFLDIYRHRDKLYVRPLKVQYRYSSSMNLMHVWDGDEFKPITASSIISEIQSKAWAGPDSDITLGSWERAFILGHEMLESGSQCNATPESKADLFDRLIRMIVSRDPGMLRLISRHLTLEDILLIKKRMVGTGLIGGKTVGMLLARAILQHSSPRMFDLLEHHDSFYVGSDVFYTFLVRNGIWWMRQKQRSRKTFLNDAGQARQRILAGQFPEDIVRQFEEMLDYFGQSPIIVRSSSLLEDNFGNSFAGKYESVFCANQGPKERRLEDFLAAVRTIYASAMSEDALRYRERRGILESDEQMALLVMRVSGAKYGSRFYPQIAGVGFSYNPYAWSKYIDPASGVVRLVFGLGTRAVDRSDDDYTRVVALNAPERRPETNFDEVRQYSQQRVDYIDLEANQVASEYFNDLAIDESDIPLDMFSDRQRGSDGRTLTFNRLLSESDFVANMREMLGTLEKSYEYPVDIEFTANFFIDNRYSINLVQCRPLPVRNAGTIALPKTKALSGKKILEAHGAVIGHSRLINVNRIVYVAPSVYSQLSQSDRYLVANIIGKVNKLPVQGKGELVLLGPGRWGTSTPSLGVPVSFNDVRQVSVMCEIVAMHEHLIPDASLGTHFLNELVEMDILYTALFPGQGENILDTHFFEESPNHLSALLPQSSGLDGVIKVIESADVGSIVLSANALEQEVICYLVDDHAKLQRGV